MDAKGVERRTATRRRADDELRLFVCPHHPDQLRVPEWDHASGNDPMVLALTWNTFRTFELLPPAIWGGGRIRARPRGPHDGLDDASAVVTLRAPHLVARGLP